MEVVKMGTHRAILQASARQYRAGFTLIELMITVAVVGILTAIAYPSYLDYNRRSERANARVALSSAVQWMERQYTTNNSYPTALSGFDTSKYGVSLSATTATSFTLEAAPSGTWIDPKCATLSVTNIGARSSGGSESADYCWSK